MSAFSVSFIVFSMFFLCFLSIKPLCSIVLLPFSAIFTNLILFVFHVSNTTGLLLNLFVICLYVCLFNLIYLGVLCARWTTHTMALLHHDLYNFTVLYKNLTFISTKFL